MDERTVFDELSELASYYVQHLRTRAFKKPCRNAFIYNLTNDMLLYTLSII